MAWGREAVETRAPQEGQAAPIPVLTSPGAIQFIPNDGDHEKIEGMIFKCPSGKGCLMVLHFKGVKGGTRGAVKYTWNKNIKYPSVDEKIFVARSGWRGHLREGRWIGEIEVEDEEYHADEDMN